MDSLCSIDYNIAEMSVARAELTLQSEQFPNFGQGGNLVFCMYANKEKLTSILSSGIRPRGGAKEAASFFPDVVSLAAVGTGDIYDIEEAANVVYFSFSLYLNLVLKSKEDPTSPFYRYAKRYNPLG